MDMWLDGMPILNSSFFPGRPSEQEKRSRIVRRKNGFFIEMSILAFAKKWEGERFVREERELACREESSPGSREERKTDIRDEALKAEG